MNDELIERKGAILMIDATDPDKFTGISSDRLATYQKVAGVAEKQSQRRNEGFNSLVDGSSSFTKVGIEGVPGFSKERIKYQHYGRLFLKLFVLVKAVLLKNGVNM